MNLFRWPVDCLQRYRLLGLKDGVAVRHRGMPDSIVCVVWIGSFPKISATCCQQAKASISSRFSKPAFRNWTMRSPLRKKRRGKARRGMPIRRIRRRASTKGKLSSPSGSRPPDAEKPHRSSGADAAGEFRRVPRMRRRHRTEKAGSHSMGAVLHQVSGSEREGLTFGACGVRNWAHNRGACAPSRMTPPNRPLSWIARLTKGKA